MLFNSVEDLAKAGKKEDFEAFLAAIGDRVDLNIIQSLLNRRNQQRYTPIHVSIFAR
jgi:hypothetical protein